MDCYWRITNLIKVIPITLLAKPEGQLYKTAVKTNIKYPEGYKLIAKSVNIGYFEIDISANQTYPIDITYVTVGKSSDGYIQYSISYHTEDNNGHTLYLVFIKENLN